MPSGGARAGAGRTPDPMALRRDRRDDAAWLTLPSGDRTDDAPAWPLEMFTDRERVVWESLWRKPIAAIWVRDGQADQVAMYTRTFVECEKIGAASAHRTLLARLAGELLLTIPAMLSAHVRIAQDELGAKRDAEPAPEPVKSARDRMTVVAGGAGT